MGIIFCRKVMGFCCNPQFENCRTWLIDVCKAKWLCFNFPGRLRQLRRCPVSYNNWQPSCTDWYLEDKCCGMTVSWRMESLSGRTSSTNKTSESCINFLSDLSLSLFPSKSREEEGEQGIQVKSTLCSPTELPSSYSIFLKYWSHSGGDIVVKSIIAPHGMWWHL